MTTPVNIENVYTTLKTEVTKFHTPVVDLINIQTKDPFKVLVATILSARTNDRTTAQACTRLFTVISRWEDLLKISIPELERLIYPVGFYHAKAKHLSELPLALRDNFSGNIPDNIDDLITLPGVGRKTANLVVAVAFNKPAICVDVHVHRIMNRLGYVRTKKPFDTEMALRKKLPIQYWTTINSILVAFGQHTCRPLRPHCSACPVFSSCNKRGVTSST